MIAGFTMVYADSSYSVNDLVSMTIQTHPNIKMQEQIIRGANAQLQGAKWNYFPTASFGVNQGANKNKLWGGTAVLEQPLWTGGKLDATYDMALANKHDSEYGLEDSGYTLVETLLNALQTYLKAKGDLEALSEGQIQLGILEGMVSRRVAAGVSSKSDMELLKGRLYQMDTDINYAKTRLITSLSQIELLTNHKFDGDLKIDERIPFTFDSLDNIIKSMINTHPTLKRLDAQLERAEAEKSKAKAVIWPNISVKAERGVGSTSLYYDAPMNETLVYFSLQASPGAGLSAFSGIESAEAKIMEVRQEKLSKQQDLINKVMFAYNDYTSSSNRIEYQSQSVGSSEKVFASYTRLFLAGKRQWLDLVNASRELTQNEMAFADTKSTHIVSAYQLALLGGKDGMLGMLGNNKFAKTKKIASPVMPAQPYIPADKKQNVTFDTIFPRKDENFSKAPLVATLPNKSKVDNVTIVTINNKENATAQTSPLSTTVISKAEKPVARIEETKSKIATAIPKTENPKVKAAVVDNKIAAEDSKDKKSTTRWQNFLSMFGKKAGADSKVAIQAPAPKQSEIVKIDTPKTNTSKINVVAETKNIDKKEKIAASKPAAVQLAIATSSKAEQPPKAKVIDEDKKIEVQPPISSPKEEKLAVKTKKLKLAAKTERQKAIFVPISTAIELPEATKVDSASGKPLYYVQFDAAVNEDMKKQLKKLKLEIINSEDKCMVGAYVRPADALIVAREVKKIICDEAFIVRK